MGIIFVSTLFSLNTSKTSANKPADMIVVLGGGLGGRIQKAWELQTKHYSTSDVLLITGIPLKPEEVIGQHPFLKYLKDHKEIKYIPVSISQVKNTWEEVLYLKQCMQKKRYTSVLIVTHPLHSGRVKMVLDKAAHFKEAGLTYSIVGDRKIEFWNNFFEDEIFREFALREVVKRIGYEMKALVYNTISKEED